MHLRWSHKPFKDRFESTYAVSSDTYSIYADVQGVPNDEPENVEINSLYTHAEQELEFGHRTSSLVSLSM